ncbi:MAG TPA: glycosyltransferase family 1 protein [Vicinamibacterales bacterium]
MLDYRPALRARTGVGEYVHELASALVRVRDAADAVVLFSSSWKDRLTAGAVPGAKVVDARVPVRVLNAAWHRLEWPPIERFAGGVDIAHSLHPLLMPARNAAAAITIHDLDFLDHPERTRAEVRRDYPRLARAHAARADLVVTISGFTAAAVQSRLGVAAERIVVCPPGAPAWTARPGPARGGPILFMGTLEPRKNVGALIEAYRRLLAQRPDAPPLWLAGAAADGAEPWLREIARPPLAGRARHLGYIESDRRYDLYAQASMLVLPSHLEGFGIPLLEAMTVGVPAIVSARGALPEVAGGAARIIDPDAPGDLAAAMRAYLEHPEEADAAAARGLERARAYSWDASARRLRAAYVEAVCRRTGARV